MTSLSWKEHLGDTLPEGLATEIDVFEQQMQLRLDDKLSEKIFAETRLRRGVYGQRYDNGRRHDGFESRALNYPCGDATKGPSTVWDAPGMMRIKIPYGGVSAEQLEVLADLSEEYSDGISHITTRQDIQLHFIHIEDTPDLMRRLGAVGITTREACGNTVRNLTACPVAGVCSEEAFDVSPYAHALTFYLLGHEDLQDFGRKVKVSFSGCNENACGLVSFHDLGFVAKTQLKDGQPERGFAFYVGGGLGAVPNQAELLESFLPESELFPLSLAVCRVFARLGEKDNRSRARMKFLLNKLGLEEFRRLVQEERAILPEDPRWEYSAQIEDFKDLPLKEPSQLALNPKDAPEGFAQWFQVNVEAQRQPGYATATIACPLGDLSAQQMRAFADIMREFTGDTLRLSVEQNLVLRWISEEDLPRLYTRLQEIGLGAATAGTIVDITACPGTDTCKLGHASSRGLAAELRERLGALNTTLDEAVKNLRIKISGCFNSCGQHHVADMGFYGIGRKIKGFMVPHFQVVLGGEFQNNGGSFGLALGAVPSKNIPAAIEHLTKFYVDQRESNESFKNFVGRVGKVTVKKQLKELQAVPTYEEDPSFYSDWGDPREFTTGDLGEGECAGAVVTLTEFGLSEAERQAFEAQTHLEAGEPDEAARLALDSMMTAARSLVKIEFLDVPDEHDAIVEEFRVRFCDTKVFFDPYAGGKFAQYLFRQHQEPAKELSHHIAHIRIEEALLFIEAAYACYARVDSSNAP
ncbi:MAG: nitrite/sulfite reductase [Myxococcota bacterium]|nr:nitrite/sulfite reductase [Myxococcota bacterium]